MLEKIHMTKGSHRFDLCIPLDKHICREVCASRQVLPFLKMRYRLILVPFDNEIKYNKNT